mmetsp:Transcript_59727/g.155350  ORF Transcript_59727/g.155350 Transcript_59727/m.155350 type:complete len:227 (+) Transcript_59727:1189-1869(+)
MHGDDIGRLLGVVGHSRGLGESEAHFPRRLPACLGLPLPCFLALGGLAGGLPVARLAELRAELGEGGRAGAGDGICLGADCALLEGARAVCAAHDLAGHDRDTRDDDLRRLRGVHLRRRVGDHECYDASISLHHIQRGLRDCFHHDLGRLPSDLQDRHELGAPPRPGRLRVASHGQDLRELVLGGLPVLLRHCVLLHPLWRQHRRRHRPALPGGWGSQRHRRRRGR